MGQCAHPVAEPPVGFLQRDDIGIYFAQYLNDPGRITAPVGADGLADIVSRNLDGVHFLFRRSGKIQDDPADHFEMRVIRRT
jgi:hypothetical protein